MLTWQSPDSLAALSTNAQCGGFTYTFYRIDTGTGVTEDLTTISPNPFVLDTAAETLTVTSTSDTNLVGVYNIIYDVCLEDYASAACLSMSTPFSIVIIDPCDTATLTAPIITGPNYTIS